jgi:hypothetical protein
VFEHVTILLSFVYAVALTHLLSSATELLIAGKRVRFSGLYAVWVLNVLQPWLWRDGERISSEPCGGRENPRRLCAISFSRHAPTCAAKSRSYPAAASSIGRGGEFIDNGAALAELHAELLQVEQALSDTDHR